VGLWTAIKSFFGFGGEVPLMGMVAQENLVAWYKMDDNVASKVVVDEKGNNGTSIRNTSLMHVAGKVAGALDLNGSSDYVNTNNLFLSTFQANFSVSVWIRPTDGILELGITNDIFGIFSSTPSTKDEILIEYSNWGETNINLVYSIVNKYNVISYAPNFIDGQETWHNIVYVVTQSTPTTVKTYLYFDGIYKTTKISTNSTMTNWKSPGNTVFIGQCCHDGVPDTGYYFNGSLDDVRIYNKALSVDEIKQIYDEGNPSQGCPSDMNYSLSMKI
jgi:trimeric autotransporter adhesin